MPMSAMPDEFDPDDPAEQGHYGERDDPRTQERLSQPGPSERRPMMPERDEDERQSER